MSLFTPPENPMVSPLDSLEGTYEIVAKIREGGMGAIYEVRHRLLHETRVVKVLHPQHDRDQELRQRFLREARAAIALRHPNVVQIFDFSLDASGTGLLVMEHIPGVDWRRLVRGGRLPSVPLALEMARQALLALGYLHRHGFVHRDVSPDNLMLSLDHDQCPLVKLIDLGIAKNLVGEELTATGSFLGKFRYASPEHFGAGNPGATGMEADPGIGPHSDLYTFGLVLYELLTGHYPMAAGETSQLVSAHLFQPPKDFAETDPEGRIPEEVRRMVLRSLEKAPADRYRSSEAWLADIAMLQDLYGRREESLEEARQWLAGVAAVQPQPWTPGSTQSKLNRNFGLGRMPLSGEEDETRTVGGEGQGSEAAGRRVDVPVGGTQKARSGGQAPAGDFETLFEAGVKSVLLRDYEKALDSFEAAQRLRPDDPRVRYNLERLRRRPD